MDSVFEVFDSSFHISESVAERSDIVLYLSDHTFFTCHSVSAGLDCSCNSLVDHTVFLTSLFDLCKHILREIVVDFIDSGVDVTESSGYSALDITDLLFKFLDVSSMITFKITDECSKFLRLLGHGGILCNKFADLCFKLAFLSIYSEGLFQDFDIPESCRSICLGGIGSNLSCICSCLGCISRCLCLLYILLDRWDDSLYDILIIILKVSQTACEVKTFDSFESSLYLTDSFLQTADSLYGSIDISGILLGQIVVLNVGN